MTNQDLQKELDECVRAMRRAASHFYSEAVRTGNHAFIEFTGLMSAYTDVCEAEAKKGMDFRFASKHTEQRMPGHKVAYIREKLDCIYGLDQLDAARAEGTEGAGLLGSSANFEASAKLLKIGDFTAHLLRTSARNRAKAEESIRAVADHDGAQRQIVSALLAALLAARACDKSLPTLPTSEAEEADAQ